MDVPRYWAEHREQRSIDDPKRRRKRSVTLRRFGWSSVSQMAAQQHAEQRVRDAWSDWDAQRHPTRREAKVAYGGADNLPIREETISEHPEVGGIVTRNGYGARCLNVPDILFADIDLGTAKERRMSFLNSLVGHSIVLGILSLVSWQASGATQMALIFIASCWALRTLSRLDVHWRLWRWAVDPTAALEPVEAWCATHPEWLIHVYRTPAGLRLLASHAEINPQGDETSAFFDAVDVDPMFSLMCRKQNCFRARVSPKPWRIGMRGRIGFGVWPATEAALPRRVAWIKDYESKASAYAACSYMHDIGNGAICERGRRVRELHDRLCQVSHNLPLA